MSKKSDESQSLSHSSLQSVEAAILLLRGQKVLLDVHLAALYGVPTKVLIQAVLQRRPT